MGSFIELNDTLRITTEQGFPEDILNIRKHSNNPIKIEELKNKIFEFYSKPKARIYHPAPTRCFLVQDIGGKWLYWGKIIILEQTIKGDSRENQTTFGKYKITEIYEPEYQKQITRHESPPGMSYF